MKKTLILVCVLWLGAMGLRAQSDSFSPAEDEEDAGVHLTVIPRVDFNPSFSVGKQPKADLNAFEPTLYSVFEGNLGEHFSFYISNHWLKNHPEDLYNNSGRTDDVSWIDMANINYNTGRFTVGAGKYCMALGSLEYDADDWDCFTNIASLFWNNVQAYQWGLNMDLEVSDNSTMTLQMLTSPFDTWAFKNKLFSYSLKWTGSFGPYTVLASANTLEMERGDFATILAIGNQYEVDDWTFGLDWMTRGQAGDAFFNQEMAFQGSVGYSFSDKVDVLLRGGYEFSHGKEGVFLDQDEYELDGSILPTGLMSDKDYVYGGVNVNYYPLKNKNLRIHAVAAANNYSKTVPLTIGATYYFEL